MADTYTTNVNRIQKWQSDFQEEFVRSGEFTRFMSTKSDNVIDVDDTSLKNEGESVAFQFAGALRGRGVTGNTPLEGNEEIVNDDAHRVWVDWYRNGVLPTRKGEKATTYDLLVANKTRLRDWAQVQVANAIVTALMSVGYEISTTSKSTVNHGWYNYQFPDTSYVSPGSTGYATATVLNNWTSYNGPVTGSHSGKLLFGAATSNYNATFATAAANVDTSSDKMTYSIVDIAKQMAQNNNLNPRLAPYTGKGDKYTEETWVMLMHPIAFQHLRDSLMATGTALLQQAEVRGQENPLFRGGDLWWNGTLCTVVPSMPLLLNIGNGANTSVVPSFLCGKNALGFAWGQLPRPTEQLRDYGFRHGVGIDMQMGCEKLLWTNPSTLHKEQNLITVFTSAGY